MTHEEASELVEDLIQAHYDYATFSGKRSYREDYHEMKRRVIDALCAVPPAMSKTTEKTGESQS